MVSLDNSPSQRSIDHPYGPGGEIGRRRGLKIPRRKACRFDSDPGHQPYPVKLSEYLSTKNLRRLLRNFGSLAQLAERQTLHLMVIGSSPIRPTNQSLRNAISRIRRSPNISANLFPCGIPILHEAVL